MDELFQIDWRIFMAGAEAWLQGRNPYGSLSAEFSAGAFAYPPTALTWMALFAQMGAVSFYIWTALELLGWWLLIRKDNPLQALLLFWSPMILHLVEGQSSLATVLVVWAASRANRRGALWGLVLAWAMTKPQVAIIPVIWLLWQDRKAASRWYLWGGLLGGTLLLALPPTLMTPHIWLDWIAGMGSYRGRLLQMAAWQGPSVALLALAAYLWHRSRFGGWQWWIAAAMFPQTSFYAMVALLPAIRLRRGYWPLVGLALAGILQASMNPIVLPWILAAHMLAAWLIAGGPAPALAATNTMAPSTSADKPL